MPWAGLAWGMAGIAGIGMLNFGVSFMLALRTAIDARDVDQAGREGLRRMLWTAFRDNPWHFIGPPKDPTAGR
jgi:site-specific recombinase